MWAFEKSKWTCDLCRNAQRDGFRQFHCLGIDHVAECRTGDIPKLTRRNGYFKAFLDRVLPGLYDGFGGISYQAIHLVMDDYRISRGVRPVMLDKVLIVVEAIRENREKERPAGNA